MANRYGLGQAQFTIVVSDEQALRAFAQLEAKARQGSQRIKQAIDEAGGGANTFSTSMLGAAKSAGVFAVAVVGLEAGLNGLVNATRAVLTETLKMKQAQFELAQTFKGSAAEYTKFAEQLARQSNRTTSEIQASITSLGVLQQNYALTSKQIEALTTLTAAYAAKSGRDMEQSARDIQAAIRGEGEAVEKLGLTLGRDFVRNTQEMTEAQRRNFFTISDLERAQIILAAAMKQSNQFQTAISDRAKDDLGLYDRWNTAVKNLSQTFGQDLNSALQFILPPVIQVAGLLIETRNALADIQRIAVSIRAADMLGRDPQAALKLLEDFKNIRKAQEALRDPQPGEPGFIGPTQKEADDEAAIRKQAIAQFESQLRNALQITDRNAKERVDAIKRALDFEIELENKAYEARRAQLQKQKEDRTQAAEDIKEAQLRAIDEEERAFKEQHDLRLAQLREERDLAKRDATDRRDDTIAAIEAEKDAEEAVAKDTIRNLEIERDARLRALEQTKDATLESIEAEKIGRIDAIEQNIALAQQQKNQLVEIAEDTKDAQLRQIEEESDARMKDFEDQIRQADDLKTKKLRDLEQLKEGRLRQLEEEKEKLEDVQRIEDRGIEENRRAIERAREEEDARFDAQKEAIDRRRQLQDREFEHQQDNVKRVRQLEDRALEERQERELAALAERNRATDAAYENDERAAREATDRIIDQIDRQKEANEEIHRRALRQIETEKDARIREIEDRLRAVDQLTKSFDNQNKLSDLGLSLEIAGRKGDLTETRRIQEEIRREQLRQSYEAARDGLKVQKDAVSEELDVRKQSLEEEFRLRQNALDEEKRLAKESLDSHLALIKSRDDVLKTSYEAEKALIRDRYETISQALQDQRFAEDAEFERRLERIADERYAEDQQFAATIKLIEDRRKIEDEQHRLFLQKLEDDRREEEKSLEQRREKIEQHYDHERQQIEDTHQATTRKLDEERDKAKEVFEDRKRTVQQAYEDEKERLQVLYDDPVNGVLAKLREQREVTQREYTARADQVRKTYDEEKQQIKDTYDSEATGLIPAIKRAVEEHRVQYDARKKQAEEVYKDEQRQIDDLYDNPTKGLLAQQQKAATEAEKEYNRRKLAVRDAYDEELRKIHAVYDDPVTGLFKKQKDAHDDIIGKLNTQKTEWENWERSVSQSIRNIMDGPLKDFIGTIGDLERRGLIAPGAVEEPGDIAERERRRQGVGRGPGPSVGTGLPFSTLFGYDQPYNGPYGGAMWPGGPTRHRGIDLTLPGPNGGRGTPFGAFRDGRVLTLTNESAGGRGVIMQHPQDNLYEYYGHMDSVNVSQGQDVRRGQLIGTLGASGLESWNTPHLHYEVRRAPNGDPVGRTIDPRPYMGGFVNTLGGGLNNPFGDVLELRPFGPHGAVIVIRANVTDWFSKARQIARDEHFSDPDLFARQMAHESINFSPEVIRGEKRSTAGAVGIAQFLPSTAAALGINPLNPIESLYGAAKLMRQLERRYAGYNGRTGQYNALWAYNAGEGNLQAGILPSETRRYLEILLPGYASGKLINEPTLMVGMRTGQMGLAGETGQPERLLGASETAAYDGASGMQSVQIPVIIGNEQIQNIIIYGLRLMVKSGRNIGVPGLNVSQVQ